MSLEQLIDDILKGEKKFYMGITGGGLICLGELLKNGGGSNVFLGANIPYSKELLNNVTRTVIKCVSNEKAIELSQLGELTEVDHIGIGVTCCLAKNGSERAGREHLVYLSSSQGKAHYSSFEDGSFFGMEYKEQGSLGVKLNEPRTRLEEENLVAKLILAYTHFSLGLSVQPPHLNSEVWYDVIGMTENDEVILYD